MKKEQLNIALIQTPLAWENPNENRARFESYLNDIPEDNDLVILPEMFTSGFTMNPATVAETMEGATIVWLKKWASQLDTAICGSLVIAQAGNYYNRFVFVSPEGSVRTYDKRHTFNMAGEGEKYQVGTEQVGIEYLGWKLFPQICYDLRFPVFARNTMDYDAIIFVANWPQTRVAAWDTLLKARAIENMSYCIGVNRVGTDGNHLEYVGHSAVYDVLGKTKVFAEAETGIFTTILQKSHIAEVRAKLPFLEDRDTFKIH